MSFLIAVSSTDGKKADLSFGAADALHVFRLEEDGRYSFVEMRQVPAEENHDPQEDCAGDGYGCGEGKHYVSHRVRAELIADCRALLCKNIGFPMRRELERKGISVFDLEIGLAEAMPKLAGYFAKGFQSS